MATVLLRHTTHTTDHRNHKKDLLGDAPPTLFRPIFESTCMWKDVFAESGLVQHVAWRFPGSCLCPLQDNSIKNSGDTERYRLGPPRQTRFNHRSSERAAVSCRVSQKTAQFFHTDKTSCVILCSVGVCARDMSCVSAACIFEGRRGGGERGAKGRERSQKSLREWHTFAPQFSRSHVR